MTGKAEAMYVTTQFSVFMVNKPGVLAQVLGEFARAKINITAVTMMDSVEHGVMRIVFAEPDRARDVFSKVNMPYNETEVLCVNLTNHPGALASVAERLAKNHINISYAYCTAGAKGGRTTGILKVADVKKAMRILQQDHKKETKSQPVIRRTRASRR
ncbi:MAG: ACT domain-containing protein [Planctomycetota bacterium]